MKEEQLKIGVAFSTGILVLLAIFVVARKNAKPVFLQSPVETPRSEIQLDPLYANFVRDMQFQANTPQNGISVIEPVVGTAVARSLFVQGVTPDPTQFLSVRLTTIAGNILTSNLIDVSKFTKMDSQSKSYFFETTLKVSNLPNEQNILLKVAQVFPKTTKKEVELYTIPLRVSNSVSDGAITKQMLSGKHFRNDCTSGEWGQLRSDGSLTTSFGSSYVPDSTSPTNAKGVWSISDGKLLLKGSHTSDGVYMVAKIVGQSDGSTIYDFAGDACGPVIGNSDTLVQTYQDMKFK